MSFELIPYALFALLISIGACFDLKFRIIPNWVCALVAVLGIATHTTLSGTSGVPVAIAGMLLPLLIFIPFYVMRVMGAGDVKLMAAVGAFVGLGEVGNMMALVMLFGGALGALQLVANKIVFFAPYLARFYYPDETTQKYVPYGLAIALGGALSPFYSVVSIPF